ncbi:MAG TPA: penicillin acylase family protein, partial [Pirellulales bacterium]|nr:penicillin acylase family protein [Pirellulales bacterium]
GFHPEPWNEQAVLLIGNLLSFGGLAVGQQQNERILVDLIQAGVDDAKMRELFAPRLDEADFDLLRQVKISNQLSDEALELITDLPRLAGSNAWAVAPARAAGGRALLAADPHLEVNRLPAIWYEAVLHWGAAGENYVLGATLPGCPLFAVARNPRLAWGVTYLKADTCDYFIEDCRPGGATGWQYRRGDVWHDFALREEIVQRKNGPTEVQRVLSSPQGTLECAPDQPGLYLAAAWVGNQPGAGGAIGVWLDVLASETAAQAMQAAQRCPQPTLNWIFADSQGHIGQQASGWVPRRHSAHSGLLPIPAWDPANHWQGTIPPDQMLRRYDPACGYVASANEDINQPGGPQICTLPLSDYRKRRIVECLQADDRTTVASMTGLQYDVLSVQARELLQIFLPHLPESPLKQRLESWDNRYAIDSTEATLFQQLYRNVLLEIFGQSAEAEHRGIGWRRMLYLCSRAGYSTMVLTAIDALLRRDQSLWWAGRDKGALIRAAAERIDPRTIVPWGKFNAFQFTNRFFSAPRMGRALGFHTGRMPMPGCHATPFQGHLLSTSTRETTFAPSYHFVVEFGEDAAWTNLPGGPSESRFSPYYKTDIPRWRTGEYKRLSAESIPEPASAPRPHPAAE